MERPVSAFSFLPLSLSSHPTLSRLSLVLGSPLVSLLLCRSQIRRFSLCAAFHLCLWLFLSPAVAPVGGRTAGQGGSLGSFLLSGSVLPPFARLSRHGCHPLADPQRLCVFFDCVYMLAVLLHYHRIGQHNPQVYRSHIVAPLWIVKASVHLSLRHWPRFDLESVVCLSIAPILGGMSSWSVVFGYPDN